MLKNIERNHIVIGLFLTLLTVLIAGAGLFLTGASAETHQEIQAGHDANAVGRDQIIIEKGVPHDRHDETTKQLGVEEEKNRVLQEQTDTLKEQKDILQKENQELRKKLEEYLRNTEGDNDQIKILKNDALKAVQADDYGQAEKLLTAAIAVMQTDTAKLTAHIGDLHFIQSDFSAAADYYSKAANMTDGAERADYLNVQGKALYNLGDCNEAEPVLNESLSIREKTFGTQNIKVVESLNNLAVCDREQGKEDIARERLKRAAEILKELSIREHDKIRLEDRK